MPLCHRIKVRALWTLPVLQDHFAYGACKDFLEYLHTTWFDGPFKDIRLNVTCGNDLSVMRTLIEENIEATMKG
ncbi:hypothetical protein COOONC_11853 [Cooperia oncophora]